MENKKTFTVVITDNETGEILLDRDDVVALIGGITYHTDEGTDSRSSGYIRANAVQIAATLDSARMAIETAKEGNPLVAFIDEFVNKYRETTTDTLDNQEE